MKFAFLAVVGLGLGGPVAPALATECASLQCAGMKLAQADAPKKNDPGRDSTAPPDEGSQDPDGQLPDDDGSEQPDLVPAPDGGDPPGCVFRKEPLELIV